MTPRSLWFRATAEGIALTASAVTVLLVARALGPATLGLLAVSLTVMAFAQAICDFGLPSLGAQLVVAQPSIARSVYRHVTLHRLLIAIATAALICAAASMPILSALQTFLIGAAVGVLFHPFNAGWLLVAVGDLRMASVVRAIGVLFTFVVTALVVRGPDDAKSAVVVLVIPALISAIASAVILWFSRGQFVVTAWKMPTHTLLGRSRDYAVADLSVLMYTYSDRLLLYVIVGPLSVGLYDAAHRAIQPFYAISAVVREAYFVDLANGLNRSALESTLNAFVRLMCIFTIPLGPFLTLFSGTVIETLYGDRYASADLILAVLGWTISVGFISGVVVLPFLAWDRGREYGRALLVGNVTNLAVNAVLIPVLGGIGAALASVSSKAGVTVQGWETFHQLSGYPLVSRIAPYAGASLMAMAMAALLRAVTRSEIVGIAAFIATYGILMAALLWTAPRRWLGTHHP